MIDSSSSRRQFVAGGIALGATLLGVRGPLALDDVLATGGWKYTDDRGRKLTRPTTPKRIVAYNDAAAALYNYGVVPVGVFGDTPRKDANLARLPWNRIKEVGTAYGELKLEVLAALKPDLIVSTWYPPPLDAAPFGFKDASQVQLVEKIAPVLAINAHVVATRGMQKFQRLVTSLGVDLGAPRIVKAKARFDVASKKVQLAAASKRPALRVLALSVWGTNVYIARPRDHADLAYYRSLGVDVVVPDTKDAYWELVSLEQIDKYAADIVIHDARVGNPTLPELLKIPAFASLPAVKAGQVAAWHAATPLDYDTYATAMTALAGTLRKARRIDA